MFSCSVFVCSIPPLRPIESSGTRALGMNMVQARAPPLKNTMSTLHCAEALRAQARGIPCQCGLQRCFEFYQDRPRTSGASPQVLPICQTKSFKHDPCKASRPWNLPNLLPPLQAPLHAIESREATRFCGRSAHQETPSN